MTIQAEIFYQGKHLDLELKIIEIIYKAKEGEYVMLDLLCQKDDIKIDQIEISYKGQIFFKGRLHKAIDSIEPDMMRLSFLAKPEVGTPLPDYGESYLKDIPLNDGFLWQVDPITHKLSTFRPFDADTVSTDLSPFIFQNSKKIETIRQRMDDFTVCIEANWEQNHQGLFDLFPYIEKSFSMRKAVTLTPLAFMQIFPEVGSTLGQNGRSKTGYSLVFKDIKADTVVNRTNVQVGDKKIPLSWMKMKGRLFIQWAACYLRKERAMVSFKWHPDGFFAPYPTPSSNTIKIHVKDAVLKDGQFFETDLGKIAINQALTQSVLKALQSRHSTCIKVSISFAHGINLRVGDRIKIDDSIGTISFLKGRYTHNQTEIVIWMIPSQKNNANQQKEILKNITLVSNDEKDCFFDIKQLSDEDLIKNITVYQDAASQNNLLQHEKIKTTKELKMLLHNNSTHLRIELRDLRNKKPFIQNYIMKDTQSCTGETD